MAAAAAPLARTPPTPSCVVPPRCSPVYCVCKRRGVGHPAPLERALGVCHDHPLLCEVVRVGVLRLHTLGSETRRRGAWPADEER